MAVRRSKHYEIRLGYYTEDENGDYEDSQLTDMIEVTDLKKYTLPYLLENLEKDEYLEIDISERFYERCSSDDQWEFIDDELHQWYVEGKGCSDMSQSSLPKRIVKQLSNWEKNEKDGV